MSDSRHPFRRLLDGASRLVGMVPLNSPTGPERIKRVRHAMIESVIDCHPSHLRRLRAQMAKADSPQALWLLRSEVYQAVTEQHDQSEAERRVAQIERLFPAQSSRAAAGRRRSSRF